jgi:hypothetical protein
MVRERPHYSHTAITREEYADAPSVHSNSCSALKANLLFNSEALYRRKANRSVLATILVAEIVSLRKAVEVSLLFLPLAVKRRQGNLKTVRAETM